MTMNLTTENIRHAVRSYITEACERQRRAPPAWLPQQIADWLTDMRQTEVEAFYENVSKWGLRLDAVLRGEKTIYATQGCGVAPWMVSREVLNPTEIRRKGATYIRRDALPEEEIEHNGHVYLRQDERPAPAPAPVPAPQQTVIINNYIVAPGHARQDVRQEPRRGYDLGYVPDIMDEMVALEDRLFGDALPGYGATTDYAALDATGNERRG